MASRQIRQWLSKELPGWEASGWVTEKGAKALKETYGPLPDSIDPVNRLFAVMATVGAALIGGGIILLFAYNWESFGRPVRTVLSFTPLALAQALALYSILKQPGSRAWKEGSAMAVITTTAACIGLISQTYHIQGDLGSFLLTWMFLSWPVVFVLRSSLTCYVLLGQFVWWMGFMRMDLEEVPLSWALFGAVLVVVFWIQIQDRVERVFLNFLSAIVATLVILMANSYDLWLDWFLILVPWLVLLYHGKHFFPDLRSARLIAAFSRVGLVILLFIATYASFWDNPSRIYRGSGFQFEWLLIGLLYIACTFLLVSRWNFESLPERFFILFPHIAYVCWYIALSNQPVALSIFMNACVVALALAVLLPAWRSGDGGGIRFGASLLTILLLLRFFDLDFSLLSRGIAFIVVGAAFLAVNYRIHRANRKGASS